MLMGDGHIRDDEYNPYLVIRMSNKRFLEWFDNQMSVFTTTSGVREVNVTQHNRDYQRSRGRDVDDWNTEYLLQTRRLPELQEFADWYSAGDKRFPDDLQLNPTITKIWYCTDGGVNIDDGYCTISSVNESDRPEYLISLFENIGFQTRFSYKRIWLNAQSNDFLEYMGRAPPGFEYKWELYNKDRYKNLKLLSYDIDNGNNKN